LKPSSYWFDTALALAKKGARVGTLELAARPPVGAWYRLKDRLQ